MSVTNETNDKIICECGSSITNQRINISKHEKTIKNKKYMENKNSKPEEIKITDITEIKNNNLLDNKEMEEKKSSVKELTSNALRVRAYRERKKLEKISLINK